MDGNIFEAVVKTISKTHFFDGLEQVARGISEFNSSLVKMIRLGFSSEEGCEWLSTKSGLPANAIELLLADTVRPSFFCFEEGLVVVLRGVNLNKGKRQEDMVSLRIWLDSTQIITISKEGLKSEKEVFQMISDSKLLNSSIDVFFEICKRLAEIISDTINESFDEVDDLEEKIIDYNFKKANDILSDFRRDIIDLKRFISPQKDVLSRLYMEEANLFKGNQNKRLRELAERFFRFAEELEVIRDRASILRDELESKKSEEMNKNMYFLSMVTFVFLPLGFLTGLLGVNLGGIPGAANTEGFKYFCGLLLIVGIIQIAILKLKKWL